MNIEEKIYNEIGLNPTLINIGYSKYLKRKIKDETARNNIFIEIETIYKYVYSYINKSNKIYVHDMRRTTRNKIIGMLLKLLNNIMLKFRMKNFKCWYSDKKYITLQHRRYERQIKRNKKSIKKTIKELNLNPITI